MMGGLIPYLELGCRSFGLGIDLNYAVNLPNGVTVVSPVRITGVGLQKGVLVFTNSDTVWPLRQHIVEAGYGYTVLDDATSGYEFDSTSFREMIIDWGWSGAMQRGT